MGAPGRFALHAQGHRDRRAPLARRGCGRVQPHRRVRRCVRDARHRQRRSHGPRRARHGHEPHQLGYGRRRPERLLGNHERHEPGQRQEGRERRDERGRRLHGPLGFREDLRDRHDPGGGRLRPPGQRRADPRGGRRRRVHAGGIRPDELRRHQGLPLQPRDGCDGRLGLVLPGRQGEERGRPRGRGGRRAAARRARVGSRGGDERDDCRGARPGRHAPPRRGVRAVWLRSAHGVEQEQRGLRRRALGAGEDGRPLRGRVRPGGQHGRVHGA